jgi:hypothetical protein
MYSHPRNYLHRHDFSESRFYVRSIASINLFNIAAGSSGYIASNSSFSSYMALQPMSGLGLLFMRFRNLTLTDNW